MKEGISTDLQISLHKKKDRLLAPPLDFYNESVFFKLLGILISSIVLRAMIGSEIVKLSSIVDFTSKQPMDVILCINLCVSIFIYILYALFIIYFMDEDSYNISKLNHYSNKNLPEIQRINFFRF